MLLITRLANAMLFVAIVFCTTNVQAELYRCTMSDGKTVFGDKPCSTGKQDVIPDQNSSQEKLKKRGKELWDRCVKMSHDDPGRDECLDRAYCYMSSSARLKSANPPNGQDDSDACIARAAQATLKKKSAFDETDKEIRKRLSVLSACFRKDNQCQAVDYQINLKCLPPVYAGELFGTASNTQSVGGREYVYYNVPVYSGSGYVIKRLQLVVGGYCDELPLPGAVSRISEINVW